MPITFSPKIKPISQDAFHAIDHAVVGLAFGVHRDLGPMFLDERIYQNTLVMRCEDAGFTVALEEPIHVRFESFSKTYYMDLLVNDSALYELKAVKALTEHHRKQAIHYLALTGLHHGQLLNFYPQSVEKEFVSSNLTREKRFQFTLHDQHWQDVDDDSRWFKQLMHRLLNEWGAFLDTRLFYDALIHFRGGRENVVKRVQIQCQGRVLGEQWAHLLTPKTALKITAITKHIGSFQEHLQRFLNNTFLDHIQWINFNHHDIEFRTVSRKNEDVAK